MVNVTKTNYDTAMLVGARPNFVKVAHLLSKFEENNLSVLFIHTGQHWDKNMSEDIFRDISHSADEVSKWRCPYKNVQDRCTAKFGCRNQDRNVPIDELYVCIGSDDIDYRPAWQV